MRITALLLLSVCLIVAETTVAATRSPCIPLLAENGAPSEPPAPTDPLTATTQRLMEVYDHYNRKLGIAADPYVGFVTFNTAEARNLEETLLNTNSALKQVMQITKASGSASVEDIDLDFFASVGEKALKYSGTKKVNTFNLYEFHAHILAVKMAIEYLNSFRTTEKPGKNTPDKPEVKKDEKKKDGEGEPPPPSYPEFLDKYPPPDMQQSESGEPGPAVVLQTVNFETPLLAAKVYSVMRRGKDGKIYAATMDLFEKPGISTSQEMTYFTDVFPQGKSEITLLIPEGHQPIRPADSRLTLKAVSSGEYLVTTNQVLKEFKIYLTKKSPLGRPNPSQLNYFTQVMGIADNEWPDKTQALLKKFPRSQIQGREAEFVRALDRHIRKEFLYFTDYPADLDPAVALRNGEFACFQGSMAFAEILRSYNIPVAVIGGRRGQKWHKGNDQKWSYVTSHATNHAYTRVFLDGGWKVYDPTPENPSPKQKNKQQKSDFSDRPVNDDSNPNNKSDSSDESNSKAKAGEGQGSGQGDDALMKMTEEIIARTREQNDVPDSIEKPNEEDGPATFTQEDLIRKLTIGALDEEQKNDRYHPLVARMQRLIMRYYLEPTQNGQAIISWLPYIKAMVNSDKYKNNDLNQMLDDYHKVLGGHRPNMKDWLTQIVQQFLSMPLNESRRQLAAFESQFAIFARTLDGSTRAQASDLLRELKLILQAYERLMHENAAELAQVDKLLNDLPPFAANDLRSRYGINKVGVNKGSLDLAKDLSAGNLVKEMMMAQLAPLTDFIMDGTPQPHGHHVKTWDRDWRYPYGTDTLPVSRRQDWTRARPLQGHLSRTENFLQGTLVANQTRAQRFIRSKQGQEETERVTYALLDGSGSMGGDPYEFLIHLIRTFAARVGSDVTPGNPPHLRHRLIIRVFNTELLEDEKFIKILNSQKQLLNFINADVAIEYSNGGTDIENVLIQVLAQIALDVKNSKKEKKLLVGANILLVSDGEANVNHENVAKARAAVGRELPVQIMFVSIGGENPSLKKLALESKQMGMDNPPYFRAFKTEEISAYLSHARKPPALKDGEYYFSDKTSADLSNDAKSRVRGLLSKLSAFEQAYQREESSLSAPTSQLYQKVSSYQPHLDQDDKQNSQLYSWLSDLRGFLHPSYVVLAAHKNTPFGSWANRLAYDLLRHYQQLSRRELSYISVREQEMLKWLLHDLRVEGGGS